MPALLSRPDVPQDALVHQWHGLYRRGAAMMPVLAGTTALGYWTVAYYRYCLSSPPAEWRGFAAAGALVLAIVPFTLVTMMPTIRALEAAHPIGRGTGEKKTTSRRTAEALLRKWTRLNVWRSLIPLVGTACAVWNLLA